ncbi:MAG: hypothetical protein LBB18_04590, partial [Puniceicoccales bacterium]|nr:hypothetical protein [Puniceicoccales bacterium]
MTIIAGMMNGGRGTSWSGGYGARGHGVRGTYGGNGAHYGGETSGVYGNSGPEMSRQNYKIPSAGEP